MLLSSSDISLAIWLRLGYPAPPTNVGVELHCDEYSGALHVTWYPSACAADKTFHGYEVTIIAFEPEYFSYETKTTFVSNLSCIFDLSRKSAMVKWSCTNCGTLYGVEVVAKNAFGKSQRIMPLYLSIKGKGADYFASDVKLISYRI